MSHDPKDFEEIGTSDCCDAPIWSGGICSCCKEHCEASVNPEEPTEEQLERLSEPLIPTINYTRHSCPYSSLSPLT
jgi:hypothetical protein